jgi:hypothetical protein
VELQAAGAARETLEHYLAALPPGLYGSPDDLVCLSFIHRLKCTTAACMDLLLLL